jgi:hypothetical protein
LGQALDTIENPLISEIPWTDCITFTPKVREILNYFCHWKSFFFENTIELNHQDWHNEWSGFHEYVWQAFMPI